MNDHRYWRSAHDVLAEWEEYETEEWARITGGAPLVRDWPPIWRRSSLRTSS